MNVQTTLEQSVPQRLVHVRQAMAAAGIDALLVPSADPTYRIPARLLAGAPVAFGVPGLGRYVGGDAWVCRAVGR